jgi:hypothetical protein
MPLEGNDLAVPGNKGDAGGMIPMDILDDTLVWLFTAGDSGGRGMPALYCGLLENGLAPCCWSKAACC